MDHTSLCTLQVISHAGHFNKWMYHIIRPYLKGNILEIGSGIGNISAYVVRDRLQVTLSDYDAAYCSLLKKKFTGNPNITAIMSINLQDPDFTANYAPLKECYDTVYLLNVIEHLQDDTAAIINCSYLLKKGGSLLVLAPAYSFLYSRFDKELGHYRRYTVAGLQKLFTRNGFGIVHRQYFNFFGMIGWYVFGKCLGRQMIGSGEMRLYNRLIPVFKLADRLVLRKTGLSAIVIGRKQ